MASLKKKKFTVGSLKEASRHAVLQVPKHAEIVTVIKKYSTSFVQKISILSRLTETYFLNIAFQ
jgi:hypothetical protein